MIIYRKFSETNDNEGATWSWWLQTDGNEIAMAHLSAFLQESYEQDDSFPYELTEDLLSESDVDLLVENAEENYYPLHNRVSGKLVLPEELGEDFASDLYKGGICDFFKDSTPEEEDATRPTVADAQRANTFADVDNVERLLGELAGAVSVCWDPRPEGVFESTRAGEFVGDAIARLSQLIGGIE